MKFFKSELLLKTFTPLREEKESKWRISVWVVLKPGKGNMVNALPHFWDSISLFMFQKIEKRKMIKRLEDKPKRRN